MIKKARKLLKIITEMDLFSLKALQFGVAAAVEHKQTLDKFEYRTIIDIGANRGQFALIARNLFPDAEIVSFEPLPEPARTFHRVFERDRKIKLYQAAIAPTEGDLEIHVSNRDDSSSLLPITSAQNKLFPGTEESGTTMIQAAPLSNYLEIEEIVAPALLKLDVQGYELEALKGSEELIDKFDHIYVECSFVELYEGQALAHEVIQYLSNHGFQLTGVYNLAYDREGKAIQGDFLFNRSE